MLSWQRHGVALTICELGNFPLWGNFPTERGHYRARLWLAEGKTEGLSCAHSSIGSLV